ncbi:MAG TPA: ABC transporter permease [Candidatus Brocadiia bacterium]|nr:ABC transporter permease [Candidatus Brocadiia bacterium]
MNKLIEGILEALEVLWGAKMRSALTMLGVIIGVFAVVMLVALGEGAKKYVVMQVEGLGLGAHTLMVYPGKKGLPTRQSTITYSDCLALKQEIPEIVELTPTCLGPADIKFGPWKRTINVFGVDSCYPVVTGRQLKEGRFYTAFEVETHRKVVVIGTTIAKETFKGVNPLGERLTIDGQKFAVIGIFEEKGRIMEFDMDALAFIPFTTAMSLFNSKRITEIIVLTKGGNMINQANDHVYEVLKSRHGGRIDFNTQSQGEILKQLDLIMNTLTMAVAGIAGVSLLVGGVGIMNIMLVAVTERTREIGIRKSIGATNDDIFQQFLVEAGIIGVVGGALGLLASIVSCKVLGYLIYFEFVTPLWSIFLGLVFSGIVGVISGVYPAMRAAKQDPIEALRYD